MLAQKGCGVCWDAKASLKELVVGLVDRGLAERHGGERWKPHAQGQQEECDDFGKLGRRGSTE